MIILYLYLNSCGRALSVISLRWMCTTVSEFWKPSTCWSAKDELDPAKAAAAQTGLQSLRKTKHEYISLQKKKQFVAF